MKSPKFIFIPDTEICCILIYGDQRCGLISLGRWIKVLVLCGNDSILCVKIVRLFLSSKVMEFDKEHKTVRQRENVEFNQHNKT